MSNTSVTTTQEKAMEFQPFGSEDKIKLTVKIVQNLVAVKTKSGVTCTEGDAIKFMMMCQSRRLNPFEGDAYLLGYDTQRDGAKFSLITAHQAFLKRAELHPEYDGMESGVTVLDKNGDVQDRQGDFHTDADKLVGAWARVHFKTRKHPMYKRLKLETFRKPYGRWQEDPAGMIVKCVEADALRSSFPTMLGGMYLREEVELVEREKHETRDRAIISVETVPEEPQAPQTVETPADDGDLGPTKPTPQDTLSAIVIGSGFTFDHFMRWAVATGQFEDAARDTITSFEEVPEEKARLFVSAKASMLKGLKVKP